MSHRLQTALWIGLGLALLWLLYLLGPVLTPFLLAGILAYICHPLVDRLDRLGLPRVAGVLTVIVLLTTLLAALVLILVPLVVEEAAILAERMPQWLDLANERFRPWLNQTLGVTLSFDAEAVRQFIGENAGSLHAVANKLFESLKIGGAAITGLLINLALVPVVIFYLLLDWNGLVERLDKAVPRAWLGKVRVMARDIDGVLSNFLRGQFMVMLALAAYYSGALAIAGLPSAVTIGIFTGLLIFVPYLGFATGFLLALMVALLQFQGLGPVIAVLVVFGLGQFVESFLLTPYLVGNRIGLHPLTVIFALMAFGQLFGFFGILLALPASAALLVGLREVRTLYLSSRFYRGNAAGDGE